MKLIVELGVTSGHDQTSVLKFCKLLYLSLQHLTWKYTVLSANLKLVYSLQAAGAARRQAACELRDNHLLPDRQSAYRAFHNIT